MTKHKAIYHINAWVNITGGDYKGQSGIIVSYNELTDRYCARVQLGLFFFNYTHVWLSPDQMESFHETSAES